MAADKDGPGRRRLIVSIHDVSPNFEEQVDALADLIAPLLGGPKFAMLVVPDHWGSARLDRSPAFAQRLRGWADAGVEMFLHGWFHRDDAHHRSPLAALKARTMTAREGEFLGLDAIEAERRLRLGRDMVEQATGHPVAGFVAPAWLYGEGAREAIHTLRFPLAEDHLRVWRPTCGTIVARGPVVTWASRTRLRTASSLAVAAVARSLPPPIRAMRVAVHPGDVAKTSIVRSIDRTLRSLAARRIPSRYADLTEAAA